LFNQKISPARRLRRAVFYWRKGGILPLCATKSPGAILDGAERRAGRAEAQDGPSNAALARDSIPRNDLLLSGVSF
jgi:hypothetical protein